MYCVGVAQLRPATATSGSTLSLSQLSVDPVRLWAVGLYRTGVAALRYHHVVLPMKSSYMCANC